MKRFFVLPAVFLLLFSGVVTSQTKLPLIWDLEACDGDMNGWYADHSSSQITRMSPAPGNAFQTNMCAGGPATGFTPPYTRAKGEVILAVDIDDYALYSL